AHAEDDAGQLSNVRRIGHALPLTVHLRTHANDEAWSLLSHRLLGADVAPLRVGFACLGPKRDNFRLESKRRVYRWVPPRHEPFPGIRDADSLGAFFGVEYADQDVLRRTHAAAVERDVDLLIYPELCFGETAELQVRRDFVASPRRSRPQLLVLGSRHVADDGARRRNSLAALGRTGALQGAASQFAHDKIGTFGFRDGSCYYVEDISRSRRLTALDVEGLQIVMLICKDVLQQTTLDTIAALAPQRLIVVAMSDKTEEFVHHFCEFAARYNTTTFFSCFSAAGETTAGVFGPGKHFTAVLLKNAAASRPAASPTPFPGSIRVDPQTVDRPCLAVIELPVEARGDDALGHSHSWFEISHV
ncbi:MAG: hypothetical protein J0M17_22910, partial [Planctomycetes bacterium]|nr:hypothetical protein [Planctomycetota bacterium]